MAVATDNIAPPSQSMDKSPATNSSDASTSDESPSAVGSSSVGVSDPVEYSDFPCKSSVQLEFQIELTV
ncbi:hypothetical protein HanXRQr2_Chr08g0334671 [Helianthus annuus]|uniref:Uncharacterized protein n=1 Tax=Helianthus annuus TaxID=4232 RepID=A0A9K3IDS2_HELAN|nr:hypothetical protein HanXRQr2_Chr08g0334671 [Helianthus annuus]KAJ0538578.1 hypothetical protein HanHA300_Chr08g0276591 [Helianthus annuus]KAJ0553199.1 hypothetical protein HanHA89_Chr08g0293781 [Helianthus annuus]KAJ0722111.1 hypothetical protein HanOQP8_Chr08g0283041 [Helianthus annuus]